MFWGKTNPTPTCNGKYLSDVEYCLMFREKGTSIGGTYKTKSKYYISATNVADKKLYKHPTIKPLEIVKNHIINSTKENDIVLDCFCGSGTTCVAAKETGRRYIGMEIDPEYYKIAVNRVNGINANGQMNLFEYEKIEEEKYERT
jgi:DNA modification methylase